MRLAKWGNSLAVRLPQAVVEALGRGRAMRSRSQFPEDGGSRSPVT